MIFPVMNSTFRAAHTLALCLILCALPLAAQKKKDNLQKPLAGPRATALRVSWLYVSADLGAQKVGRVQIGRELVVAEKSGAWLRVFANTDIEEEHTSDAPIFDTNETPPPISGWMQAKGVVIENTPNGDQILLGAAANQEALASNLWPGQCRPHRAPALPSPGRDVSELPARCRGSMARRRYPLADSEGRFCQPPFRKGKGAVHARADG